MRQLELPWQTSLILPTNRQEMPRKLLSMMLLPGSKLIPAQGDSLYFQLVS